MFLMHVLDLLGETALGLITEIELSTDQGVNFSC